MLQAIASIDSENGTDTCPRNTGGSSHGWSSSPCPVLEHHGRDQGPEVHKAKHPRVHHLDPHARLALVDLSRLEVLVPVRQLHRDVQDAQHEGKVKRRGVVPDRTRQRRFLALPRLGCFAFLHVVRVRVVHLHKRDRSGNAAEGPIFMRLGDDDRVVRGQHDGNDDGDGCQQLGRARDLVRSVTPVGQLIALVLGVERHEHLERHERRDEGARQDASRVIPRRRAEGAQSQEQPENEVERREEGVQLTPPFRCRVGCVLAEPHEHDDCHSNGCAKRKDRDEKDKNVPWTCDVFGPIQLHPCLIPLVYPLDEDDDLNEQEEN
mmetsp:Transcript_27336/g.55881  ORF Transcript_27336/g.55881 Transcript_27336/m.55881 type:complete len:321 (-) Transcript_27336:641-1603(-)